VPRHLHGQIERANLASRQSNGGSRFTKAGGGCGNCICAFAKIGNRVHTVRRALALVGIAARRLGSFYVRIWNGSAGGVRNCPVKDPNVVCAKAASGEAGRQRKPVKPPNIARKNLRQEVQTRIIGGGEIGCCRTDRYLAPLSFQC